MQDTLENPVIKEDLESQLMEAASKADRGDDFQLPSAQGSEDRTPDTTDTKTESNSDTTPEKKDDRPRDELGRFTKKEDGTDIPESERTIPDKPDVAEATKAKPESAYDKAKKERERQENLLKNFEEEKRKSREEIETQRRQVEAERQRILQWQEQQRNSDQQRNNPNQTQYTSKDYADFAQRCTAKAKAARDRGDYDEADSQASLATESANKALELRETEATQQYQQAAVYHERLWESEMQNRMREEPELQNRDSEMAKATMSALAELPGFFERIPPMKLPNGKVMGGFSFAVEYAKLQRKAGAASGLEADNKKLKAEVERLNKLTGINGAGPSSPVQRKSFNELAPDEQERQLLAAAADFDSGR